MATNILLYQTDAVTHNFYLYNPVGSEKLYFLPWDYDGAIHPDSVLTNGYDYIVCFNHNIWFTSRQPNNN